MFFETPKSLLAPIYSLLAAPFKFAAGASIAVNLREHLYAREDFEDLLALGCLFEEANKALLPSMALLRAKLSDELALMASLDEELDAICRSDFKGLAPLGLAVDGARYQAHASVQCQLDRLFDLFELRRSGKSSPITNADCADAIRLLMLSEALALSLAGIAAVRRTEGRFEIFVRDTAARDALRRTWFARMADQSSFSGALILARELARSGAKHVLEIEELIDRIFDRDLSLPWHRMSAQGRSLRSVQHIRAAAELVAMLMVLEMRGESLQMTGPALAQHGLDFGVVSSLIRRQVEILETDKFLIRRGDSLHVRVAYASKGLRALFRQLEGEFGEGAALGQHAGGFFYEEITIRQRIEIGGDYRGRYQIREGFRREQVLGDVPNESDVEFIICDQEQGHYYFVQIKHALLGETAFLQAVIKAIQRDIGKGLHQLGEAKRLLANGLLDATLKARGIDDATPENSTFVLLHNIAQLDYQYSSAGICLYDWATFRNLLKDAECRYGHSDGPCPLVRLPTPLVASHPTAVIRRLLAEHPAYSAVGPDPWAQERSSMEYEVLGRTIMVRGLGI